MELKTMIGETITVTPRSISTGEMRAYVELLHAGALDVDKGVLFATSGAVQMPTGMLPMCSGLDDAALNQLEPEEYEKLALAIKEINPFFFDKWQTLVEVHQVKTPPEPGQRSEVSTPA